MGWRLHATLPLLATILRKTYIQSYKLTYLSLAEKNVPKIYFVTSMRGFASHADVRGAGTRDESLRNVCVEGYERMNQTVINFNSYFLENGAFLIHLSI